jgi:hypothetical protein
MIKDESEYKGTLIMANVKEFTTLENRAVNTEKLAKWSYSSLK